MSHATASANPAGTCASATPNHTATINITAAVASAVGSRVAGLGQASTTAAAMTIAPRTPTPMPAVCSPDIWRSANSSPKQQAGLQRRQAANRQQRRQPVQRLAQRRHVVQEQSQWHHRGRADRCLRKQANDLPASHPTHCWASKAGVPR